MFKSIEYVLKHSSILNDYTYRIDFVDSLIEEYIQYFMNTKTKGHYHNLDIAEIYRVIRKNREVIVKRGIQPLNRKDVWQSLLKAVKELLRKTRNSPTQQLASDAEIAALVSKFQLKMRTWVVTSEDDFKKLKFRALYEMGLCKKADAESIEWMPAANSGVAKGKDRAPELP